MMACSGLVDAHCHIDFIYHWLWEKKGKTITSFANFKHQLKEEFPPNFEACIAVFCNPVNWQKGIEKILSNDNDVWFTYGVHPHHSNMLDQEKLSLLETLLDNPKVVALGEIGLDYRNQKYH